MAVFLVAILPLVDGLRRTIWAAHAHQPIEPIGWMELVVAAALFASTANVWGVLPPRMYGIRRDQGNRPPGDGGRRLSSPNVGIATVHFGGNSVTSEHRSKTHNIP